MSSEKHRGRLYVVATPIGNLEDITLRAIRVLREVDCILAEDTRHTRKLCASHAIGTRLASLHAHTRKDVLRKVVEELVNGSRFALVSDAGTPLVSDPGAHLVREAQDAGIPVEAVPGASALTAALAVCGIACDRFRFAGFMPRSGGSRRDALRGIAQADVATILFESPQRLAGTLEDLEGALGPDRVVAICRELTKVHEQVIRSPLSELRGKLPEPLLGEITLVIAPGEPGRETSPLSVDEHIQRRLAEGLSPREVARAVSAELGVSRRDVYQRVLMARRAAE